MYLSVGADIHLGSASVVRSEAAVLQLLLAAGAMPAAVEMPAPE